MIEADVIVMVIFLYYNMNIQVKILIDRIVVRHKRLNDKEFNLIVSIANPKNEGIKAFYSFRNVAKEKGIIYGNGV